MTRPHKVTQSYWVVKCIRMLPGVGRCTEVTRGLRELVAGLWGFSPFIYRGFLTVAEDVLETLRDEQMSRPEAAHQLIYDVLVEPTGHLN